MNKFITYFFMAFVCAGFFSSCEDETGNQNEVKDGYDFSAINTDYVDKMVVPVYADLKDKSQVLLDAANAIQEDPSAANIAAACAAWRAARIPWEQSEAFLFEYGPAASQSLDPSLDSWPLNKTDILGILKGSANISVSIGGVDVHGFHTIEYLLFSGGNPKTQLKMESVDDPSNAISSDRIAEYLVAASEVLHKDCFKLWALWVGESALNEEQKEYAGEIELVAGKGFVNHFKNAGAAGSLYLSSAEAFDNIIEGCIIIAGEVGSQKINAPYEGGNVLDVESWYSFNSLDDFKNNILSIKGSYFGGWGKTSTTATINSPYAFVKTKDAALNDQVVAAIDNAYNAINGIPAPFRDRVANQDQKTKVEAAVDACKELEVLLGKVKTLNKDK